MPKNNEVRQIDLNRDKRDRNNLRSTLSRVIYFDNSMSADTITAKIASLHKHIPYGETLLLQFADGTYSLTDSILINGFYGGGALNVYAETDDKGATKSTYLNFTGSNDGLVFENIFCMLTVGYLKVKTLSSTNYIAFLINNCPGAIIRHCLAVGNSATVGTGSGIAVLFCIIRIRDCYFTEQRYAIVAARGAIIHSDENASTGTNPGYGLYAKQTGCIGKEFTQPTGSVANELTATGGIIRA